MWSVDPGDLRTRMHQEAFPGEDISDRPLPETVVPAFLRLLDQPPASGRIRLADVLMGAAYVTLSPPTPTALWLPYEVADVDAAAAFFIDQLGLSQVDGWDRAGGRGLVLRAAEAAFVELASPGAGAPAPVAFELGTPALVDAVHRRFGTFPIHPAGSRAGTTDSTPPRPVGRVMVWSER